VKLLEDFRSGNAGRDDPGRAFGLPLVDGQGELIAADVDRFADALQRLVEDESLRQRIRNGGYSYLEDRHSLPVAQDATRRVLV